MNIFLSPIAGVFTDFQGYMNKLGDTLKEIPAYGEKYKLVSDESLADFVIGFYNETTAGSLINIIKPLTKRDIQTFTWDISDRPTGRLSGFYCSLPVGLFDDRRHSTLSYPVIFNEMIEEFPRHDASIDFSFIGAMSAGVRVRLVAQFRDCERTHNAIVKVSEVRDSVLSEANRARNTVKPERLEFADLLRRSKFVLCPRGYGTGTHRMFEAMQAGRVPVIISDAYVKPAGIDWDSCSLTIPESRIAEIPEIIKSRLDDWEILAANARAVWEGNFSPRHVMDHIATNLARMSQEISQGTFSPLQHSVRVGAAVIQDNVRPIAGHVKQIFRSAGILS
jgi:Exostosin family